MRLAFVTDNLALKLVSLVLAALLWFIIAGEKSSERALSVPLEFQNVPKDLELTSEPASTVDVRVRASPGVIERLTPGDVAVQVDLSGAREGERIVHLTGQDIRLPFGVRVVKITPATLSLTFDRTLQKVVPIRPRLVGRPAAGYEVTEVTSEPREVQVLGPRGRLQWLESAFTEPLPLEGERADVSEQVNVGLEDPVLRILGNPRVRVSARIREVQETRSLAGLPIEVRGGTASLRPGRATVVLAGPAAALRAVVPAQVKPYVDLAGANGGMARVLVELPPAANGVTIKGWTPVEVTVRALPSKGRKRG
jgi:YbbR domain-containing protein